VAFVKRDTVDLLTGLGVLALGIGILLFTFSLALGVAQNPGEFFRNQMAQTNQQVQAPTADFTYTGFDLNVTFTDKSTAGSGSIQSWSWNFGDNGTSNRPSPSHRFVSYGAWQVSLTVTDSNGQQSRTFAQLTVQPHSPISGNAVGSLLGGSGGFNVNLDLGVFLIPVGVGLLTTGMFLVMALIGGLITKAGWNLIKPKPETIRVRLKPKDLTRAFEDDSTPMVVQPQGGAPPPPPPP
jgi:hypothetical protein